MAISSTSEATIWTAITGYNANRAVDIQITLNPDRSTKGLVFITKNSKDKYVMSVNTSHYQLIVDEDLNVTINPPLHKTNTFTMGFTCTTAIFSEISAAITAFVNEL